MGNGVPPVSQHFRGNGIFFAAKHIDMVADIDIAAVVNIRDVNGSHLHGDIAKGGAKMPEKIDMGHKAAVFTENTVAAAVAIGIANADPSHNSIAFSRKALHVAEAFTAFHVIDAQNRRGKAKRWLQMGCKMSFFSAV